MLTETFLILSNKIFFMPFILFSCSVGYNNPDLSGNMHSIKPRDQSNSTLVEERSCTATFISDCIMIISSSSDSALIRRPADG